MAGPQRQQRPQSTRGDFTGNQKEVLQREHEEAVEARREELGLISASNKAIQDDGVIDLTGARPVLEGTDQPIDAAARQPSVLEKTKEPSPDGERIGSGTTNIDVYELPAEKPQAAVQAGEVLTKELQNAPTLVRAVYDLEDVTIGYGNTFNFRAGYRYRVPRWVAAHLEEKGLAIVLSLTPA